MRIVWKLHWFAALSAAAHLAAGLAAAQGAASDKDEAVAQALRRLEARIEALEKQVGTSQPDASAGESAGGRLEELDQRIRVAERVRELEREAAAASAKEAPVVQAGRTGFFIKSASGDFQLRVGGYMHADGRFYASRPASGIVDTFVLRRVRPVLEGTVAKYVNFRLMPDFGEGKTVLQDAYVELRYFPKATLRAGKFKAPFGLERLQSATDILFVERGLPTALVPNRDLGVQLSGDLAKGRLNYAAGVFNGTPDGGSVDADSDIGKDTVLRVFATPFQTAAAGHPLKGLGFGVAASIGSQRGALPSFKTAGQATFFGYASGAAASGNRTRVSPQAQYYQGPLGLFAEYVQSNQRIVRGAAAAIVNNSAWQVAGSYLLTGETKARGLVPLQAMDPGKRGWGAWEIAGRFGHLKVDPVVYSKGLADPASAARRARAWAAGLNWYLNGNVKTALDYEQTSFEGGAAAGGRRPRESTILSRIQVGF
jgi:phosphate-selective porin OprO and OprP